MMDGAPLPRIVALCTTEASLDTVNELVRLGIRPAALVGLHPEGRGRAGASGWEDVRPAAAAIGAEAFSVRSYALDDPADRAAIEALAPELVLVLGWQRLIPHWLIDLPPLGALGAHGSPDGISGGRGRSPQNWALMLGAETFELALFRITPGVDDGPVLATRTFAYTVSDDIRTSYQRASLALAEMVAELLKGPLPFHEGAAQAAEAAYLPQRRPEHGWVDWSLPGATIAAHCRALTRPYSGLRTADGSSEIVLWRCQPFDREQGLAAGEIGPCFRSGEFLVGCGDGRLLIRDWSAADPAWKPAPGLALEGRCWQATLEAIVERHRARYPDQPISQRILSQMDGLADESR